MIANYAFSHGFVMEVIRRIIRIRSNARGLASGRVRDFKVAELMRKFRLLREKFEKSLRPLKLCQGRGKSCGGFFVTRYSADEAL